ncbi:hypothetical protein AAMO2058_000632300 [Amorphochlora amoebiformis]|uniref:Uncharacterized protein n=1 Tax=Amorphochlora amoebiformis TaxID=1561963 RepID=A0A6T6T9S0_9EUKA|mmetsp:Transcript_17636/g.28095  ORF Transcript_17636/g.28095 Transcript_17636/m.28095 type:complete len:143 (+) Transcript_17636:855-1283(+)
MNAFTHREITANDLDQVAMQKGDSSHYTVLITGIPDELDTDEKIRAQLEPKFPGSIAYVKPVKNLTDAAKKVCIASNPALVSPPAHNLANHRPTCLCRWRSFNRQNSRSSRQSTRKVPIRPKIHPPLSNLAVSDYVVTIDIA